MKLTERLRAIGRPRTKADFEWIGSGVAWDELAKAFSLPSEVASMLLHGLVASGTVHALDGDEKLIDLDDCTIADLEGRVKSVSVDELGDWIVGASSRPQRNHRNRVIVGKLQSGDVPGRNVPWKKFCDDVRNLCNGWGAKGRPATGFSNKQIQRAVNDLMSN